MFDEKILRRAEFLSGPAIRLADGQLWIFPPPSSTFLDASRRDRYDSLLLGVVEAEDEFEKLRAEMALAVHLLSYNYDLSPDHYQQILACPPGDVRLDAMKRDFRAIASDHVRARRQAELAQADLEPKPSTRPHFWSWGRRRAEIKANSIGRGR